MELGCQGLSPEPRDGWMVMLLKDLREVARRDNLDVSVDALTFAIAALRLETSGEDAGPDARAALAATSRRTRH